MKNLYGLVYLLCVVTFTTGFVLLDGPQGKSSRVERSADAGGGTEVSLIGLIDSMFVAADRDGDGGLNEDEFWGTFAAFDSDGDDIISLREYVVFFNRIMGARLGRNNPMRMRIGPTSAIIFNAGDMNGDRRITRDEDATVIFRNLDQDGNQFISKEEYFMRWQVVMERLSLRTQAQGKAPKEENPIVEDV